METQARARRREELTGRLIDLFLTRGFADFGVADLARLLRCSKTTLYAVAESKEQIITAVVRAFFRRATERVEARLAKESDPRARVEAYLRAISTELSAASPAFFADLTAFAPAHEIYRRNTAIAAERVRGLVLAAVPGRDAAFAGAVAGLVMEAVHRGDIKAATGLDDSAAYAALATLLVGPNNPA
ncbi:TetR/AcrR family transcriptional regulator [Actinocorallia sp. A-T 12471]|uniref:TetR/AcrR family transcriptional regulator n=1 Tax=Actinocorallia sp. A-T 12471 TaxID=3089813 RepID=UPI0029D00F4D|nr:TetR/AcrR family transcriptional regulator [Actinocorallia sp. A-T 12471]MDX6740116.1 TetR/AcrR family transcriptional regulator [Actinocorallia sp. A-T 12471]